MGLLKTVLVGAAVYGAYKYATKKDSTGRSIVDDLKERAPEFMEKARNFTEDLEGRFTNKAETATDIKL